MHLDNRLDDMEATWGGDTADGAAAERSKLRESSTTPVEAENQAMDASFMSESIYEKLPSPRTWKHKSTSR